MSMYGKYKEGERAIDPFTDFSGDKGLTVQADRDEADINKIVARFQKSGQLPPSLKGEPFYGDVSEIGDYQECLMRVQEANGLFMSYPAEVRERFNNDPAELVDFLANGDNYEEALKLGLVVERPKPVVPPVVPPIEGGSKPV